MTSRTRRGWTSSTSPWKRRGRVAELDQSGHRPKEPLLAYLAQVLGWPESVPRPRHQRFDPAIFAQLVSAWGLSADALAFVGDHPEKDVLGARAAGMLPIWIADGRRWPLGEPMPLQVDHVLELEALLHGDALEGGR